jgi:hypothetical protein
LVAVKGIQMKNILIITPHYPPSNLAAVHRSRLFAEHLPSFGWKPIILTVHEKFYEEKLDWNLFDLVPNDQRIEKVKAFKTTTPRIIGDIGLRGFIQIRRRALVLIKSEKIDFVYIPIPSFYMALIGPYLFKKTGVKYGIDYIDACKLCPGRSFDSPIIKPAVQVKKAIAYKKFPTVQVEG